MDNKVGGGDSRSPRSTTPRTNKEKRLSPACQILLQLPTATQFYHSADELSSSALWLLYIMRSLILTVGTKLNTTPSKYQTKYYINQVEQIPFHFT